MTDLTARAATAIESCRKAGIGVVLAESLTGGMIADTLISVPGASSVVVGSVVAYRNAAKQDLLGIPAEVLAHNGAVSEVTAAAMASAVRSRITSEPTLHLIGLSATGVAGPDLQDGKPVGTVFLGLATAAGTEVRQFAFQGDRIQIRSQATNAALNWLIDTAEAIAN
ncbi:MAG: hypothetical protein RL530_470 [Actinomycetota bacterium]